MQQKAVQVRDLSFWHGNVQVLRDVQLSVEYGDYLAIVGPNGGGKTTLVKLILGLLRPDQGKVLVFGKSPAQNKRKIGYMPQQPDIKADFPITVQDVVGMGLMHKMILGWRFSKQEKQKAMRALEQVNMEDFANRQFADLSGGQMRRVLIARALVSEPEMLILDEPASNIDPHGKFCFFELLAQLSNEITIILVSHDLSITTAGVSAIACVNKELYYNPEPRLTDEMFSLLYGVHKHSCPLAQYGPQIKDVITQARSS